MAVLLGALVASLFFVQIAQAATPPTNVAPPVLSGTPQQGQTLSLSNGSWTGGKPPYSYYYYWHRCTAAADFSTCSLIAGANNNTYMLTSADVGKYIVAAVAVLDTKGQKAAAKNEDKFAKDSGYSFAANPVGPVLSSAPSNSSLPVVTGDVAVGSTLQTSNGSWTSSTALTYAYQWLRCDIYGQACAAIAGAASNSYTVQSGDQNGTLRSAVTATNSGGSTTALSNPAGQQGTPTTTAGNVPAGGALTSAPPTAQYPLQVKVETPNAGSVSILIGSPTLVPPAGVTWIPVEGTVHAPDASVADPLQLTFRYDSTVIGAEGAGLALYRNGVEISSCQGFDTVDDDNNLVSAFQRPDPCVLSRQLLGDGDAEIVVLTSQASVYNAASPPVNATLPVISGSAVEAQVLNATAGTYDGTAAPLPTQYTYQWQRCNAVGASCVNVGSAINTAATSVNRTVITGDVGFTLRISVVARNANGAAVAVFSAATAVVTAAPPTNTSAPTISGTAQEGATLTSTTGVWTGGTITFTRQWQRCQQDGVTCVNISGATANTYVIVAGDVGSRIRVVVTATNSGGSASKPSNASASVTPAVPVNTAAPTLSGTAQENQTMTTSNGSWSGAQITFTYKWQNSPDGAVWTDIAGATSSSFVVRAADIGKYLRSFVTATNSSGTATKPSAASAQVLPAAPTNTVAPALSGTAQENQTLSVSNGTWTSSVAPSFAYQWQRSDGSGGYNSIAGAVSSSYALVAADIGHTMRAIVTASNAGGSSSANSNASATVLSAPPTSSVTPVLSGTAREGQTLSVTNGTFNSSSPLTYAYQWQSSNGSGGYDNITGATSNTYVLTGAEIGHTIRARVTASNDGGSASAFSNASASVLPVAPSNTAAPVLSGTAREGQTLAVDNGVFSSSAALTYSYQWQRSNGSGGYDDIAGATANSYLLVAADIGHTMRARVTAQNAGGSASANSNSSATVLPIAPSNTVAPALSGTAREGQTLSVDNGSFTSSVPLSYAYQWQSSNGSGGYDNISGATANSYVLQASDVGHTILARVTASNAGGSTTANSNASASVLPLAPSNTAAPVLSGTAQEGQSLHVTNGTFSSSAPLSYAYQWQRSNGSGGYDDISGANAADYTLVAGDIGHTIRARVTATNDGGSDSANSNASATVIALPPVNVTRPQISGTFQEGSTVSAVPGSWSSSESPSYSYQWQRSDGSGGFVDIAGETGTSYTLTSADVGFSLRLAETATNSGGSVSAYSDDSSAASPLAPASTTPPTISGTPREGQTLSASTGSWTKNPTSYAYQWQSCDLTGAVCSDISGATAADYVLSASDLHTRLLVVVTASNAGGSGSASSAPTAEVLPNAPSGGDVSISGSAREGQTLSASPSGWTSSEAISYAYQWQSSNGSGGYDDISGATSSDYAIQVADIGHALRVHLTASNSGGSNSADSSATSVVLPLAPTNTSAPTISGSPREDSTLTANNGTWQSSVAVTYTYQWERSDGSGGFDAISGANDQLYQLQLADVQHTVRVLVVGSNDGGFNGAYSAPTAEVLPLAPSFLTAPAISGEAREGQTLAADNGSWEHNPTSYDYQWVRCDSAGSNCQPISSAVTNSYSVTAADIGSRLAVVVTASNAGGQQSVQSSPTAVVLPLAPVADSGNAPVISGSPQEGRTLSVSNGGFSSSTPVSYSYQWQSSNGSGGYDDIAGATDSDYLAAAADIGHTLRAVVIASNSGGSDSAFSAATATVLQAAPSNLTAPSINGVTTEGQTLSADLGTWSGSGNGYSYRWLRCQSDHSGCSEVGSGSSYDLVLADAGSVIALEVTASNDGGSDSATVYTPVIAYAAPVNDGAAPQLLGDATVGSTLTVSPGGWSHVDHFDYQWYSCDADGLNCVVIVGATGDFYQLMASDAGSRIAVSLAAAGPGGSLQVSLGPTAVVQEVRTPQILADPVIVALPSRFEVGQSVRVTDGDWANDPTDFRYQWQSSNGSGGYDDIADATNQIYHLVAADSGHTVRAVVIASNSFGDSAPVATEPTPEVSPASSNPPISTSAPVLSGNAVEGDILSVDPGSWSPTADSYSYQWLRCSPSGSSCAAIPGATASDYTLTADDVNHKIQALVYGANGDGTSVADSNLSGLVAARAINAPTATTDPSISPTFDLAPGDDVNLDHGVWDNNPTEFHVQWQRSFDNGASWQNIAVATGDVYTVTNDDLTSIVRARVRAVAYDSGGLPYSGTAYSNVSDDILAAGGPPNLTRPEISDNGDLLIGATPDGGGYLVTPNNGVSVGDVMTATDGTWDAIDQNSLSFDRQWKRCNAGGTQCVSIADATSSSYTVVEADRGKTLRFRVLASSPEYARTARVISDPQTPMVPVAAPGDCNSASPPANDDFDAAQVLSGSGSVAGTLCGSTDQTINSFPEADPDYIGINGYNTLDDFYGTAGGARASGPHSVWYKFQAPADGSYFFSSAGSAVTPDIHVYKSNAQTPSVAPIWPTNGDPYCDDCMYGLADAVDGTSSTGGFSLVTDQIVFIRVVNPYTQSFGEFTLTYGPFDNTDFDNDGVTNAADNCPNKYNPSQKDVFPIAPDGIGDACQTGLVIYNNTGYVIRGYTPPGAANSYISGDLYTSMQPTGEECSTSTCYFTNPQSQVWHAEQNFPYCSDNLQIQPYYHCVDTSNGSAYFGSYDINNPGTIMFVNDGYGTDGDFVWAMSVHFKLAGLCEPDDNASNCQDYNVPDPWVNGATNSSPVNSARDWSESNNGVEYLTFG